MERRRGDLSGLLQFSFSKGSCGTRSDLQVNAADGGCSSNLFHGNLLSWEFPLLMSRAQLDRFHKLFINGSHTRMSYFYQQLRKLQLIKCKHSVLQLCHL